MSETENYQYSMFSNMERRQDRLEEVADRLTSISDRKSTRLNSSHVRTSRMPSSA